MECNSWVVFPFPIPDPVVSEDAEEDFCPVALSWLVRLDLCWGRGENLIVALLTASLTLDISSSSDSLDLVRLVTFLRSSDISCKMTQLKIIIT